MRTHSYDWIPFREMTPLWFKGVKKLLAFGLIVQKLLLRKRFMIQ